MKYGHDKIYEGWWMEGTKHGMGRLIIKTINEAYIGGWNENERHGLGC